jgi:hypothetical protein
MGFLVQIVDDRMEEEPTQTQPSLERMGSEPPTRLISWVKSHAPRLTHVTHEVACVPSACIHPQELRTKHTFHMDFWNNIKILFPRT